MRTIHGVYGLAGAMLFASVGLAAHAQNGPANKSQPDQRTQDVIDYWTNDRIKSATPRDLFIDHRGLGYIRSSNGGLTPYGHEQRFSLKQERIQPTPQAKPAAAPTPIGRSCRAPKPR